ncbi:MAG: hypothetical protein CMF59_13175 [Leptospiraceae bacterium]|nr:hypothetical protein [Leptospiraceae bacterium]
MSMLPTPLKRYGQPVLIVVIFLLVMLAAGIITGILNTIWEALGLDIPRGSAFKLLLSIPFIMGTVVLYLYPGRQNGGLSWQRQATDLEKMDGDSRALVLAAVFFLIPVGSQGAASVLEALSFQLYPNYELYETLMNMFHPTGHWLDIAGAIITVGLVGPICEEMVFRGFMLRGLLKNGANLHIAVVLQGFLFGLVHGNPYQFSYAWPLGILLGYMAVYSRFGWATIWVHSVTNLFAVFAMYGFIPALPAEVEPGQFLPSWFILGGCAMLAGGIYLYFHNVPPVILARDRIAAVLAGSTTNSGTDANHTITGINNDSAHPTEEDRPVSGAGDGNHARGNSDSYLTPESGAQERLPNASDINRTEGSQSEDISRFDPGNSDRRDSD